MNHDIESDRKPWPPAAATVAELTELGFYDKSADEFEKAVEERYEKNEN